MQIDITLTAVGSASGAATLTLPFNANGTWADAGGGVISKMQNMTGLTGTVQAKAQTGGVIALVQNGATGQGNLQSTSFTNTSSMNFTVQFAV